MGKNNKIKKIMLLFVVIIVIGITIVFATNNKFSITAFTHKLFAFSNEDGSRKKYNFNNDWSFSIGKGNFDSDSFYIHYCKIGNHNDCVDALSSPGSDYEIVNSISVVTDSDKVYENTFSAPDDSRFSDVSLPHTYNDIDTFDNYTEGAQNGDRSTYTGTAWYKKTFYVPDSYSDKKVYIEFEAARQAMNIYVNGTKLEGTYENGFIPVGYDLSPYLVFGANNYITIETDNSFPYYMDNTLNGSTTSKVLWHNSHWHPNYGGLYRNSYLYVMDELHLTLPLYSFIEGEGTYIYSSNIKLNGDKSTSATINVDAQVENSSGVSKNFSLKSTIYNKDGSVKDVIVSDNKVLNAGEKEVYHLEKELNNLIRWSDDYPYLYTVKTEIISDGVSIDNNSIDIGVRTFRITSDSGFYLNENKIILNGWGQKSTMEWAGLGSALPDNLTDYVIKMMKDANANYIRWGHTAGSPTQITSSDKYGLLVTQPGVDGEGNSEGTYDVNNAKLRIEAMRDMIIYFRNNPSIIMWEIGNQASVTTTLNSTYINSIKGLETTDTSASMYSLLSQVINQFDYGNRGDIVNSGTFLETTTDSDRLVTIRRGNNSVSSFVENEETTLGEIGIKGKTYVEGEYNRLESSRRIWDSYTTPFSTTNSYYKTSEDYAISQIKDVTYVTGQPKIVSKTGGVGGANWIFSDSESHGRVTTEVTRVSGEVDAVMLPKEAYYVDRVVFNKNPDLYIIGHWNYTNGTVKNVYVAASNVAGVSLFVNDTRYEGTLSNNYLWTFPNVTFESGKIKAVAYDNSGHEVLSTEKNTHKEPDHIVLSRVLDDTLYANGSDILLVDATVVDSDGNRCLTYDGIDLNDKVTFDLNDENGVSIWRGGYNSSLENTTNKKDLYLEAGINRIAIKTTNKSGEIILSASSDSGLTSNTLSVNTVNVTNTLDGLIGVSNILSTTPYDLSGLSDPGVGNANASTSEDDETINGRELITKFTYTGSINENNGINMALGVGSKMYSDSEITFADIPYMLNNSEYLLLPNDDKASIATDLITFEAKKDIDVFVIHDQSAKVPDWLSSYTKTSDVVLGGNGVDYYVYKISVNKGDTVTLGGNVDSASDGFNTQNQIIAVKSSSQIAENIYFEEDFVDFDTESLNNGWNVNKEEGTDIAFDNTSFTNNTIHFTDTNSTNIAFMQKSFSPLKDKIRVKTSFYLPSSDDSSNSWIRLWLTDGGISNQGDKSKLGVEAYLNYNASNNTYFLNARIDPSLSGDPSLFKVATNISADAFHTVEVEIDLKSGTYQLGLDDKMFTTKDFPIYTEGLSQLSNIVIGTWKSGNSDFYLSNVSVNPMSNDLISNVKIDGVLVDNFSSSNNNYYLHNIKPNSVVTFNTTEFYKSSTSTYDSVNKRIVLNVEDVSGNVVIYYFYSLDESSLLEDFTISAGEGTSVGITNKNGIDSIHLYDNDSTTMAYIMKEINTTTDKIKVEYSSYVTDLKTNQYLRMWLLNGPMTNDSIKSNVGISSYLSRNSSKLAFWNEEKYSSSLGKGTNITIFDNNMLNKWYKYTYIIDKVNHTYELYVDDLLVGSDIPFLTNQDTLDYIVFGTGKSTTSDYYLKDISVSNIYDAPITGINIDDRDIAFDGDVYIYDFFTLGKLSNDTIIKVNEGISYKSHVVRKDLIEQKAYVDVTNYDGVVFTYEIVFKNIIEEDVSKDELRELINQVGLLTPTDYSSYSWDILKNYVDAGNLVLADENANGISIATSYYYIREAMNALIPMLKYEDYKTSLFDNIFYSEDLLGKFSINKVLDLGSQVYLNDDVTFTSVPLKYYNAEYFRVLNEPTDKNGSFVFTITATRDVSLLIFKDRDAGPVTNEDFTYTGDILTGSNGVVYKVYRKTYHSGDEIDIDFRHLVSNQITGNNSIIAIKDDEDVSNNVYFNQDMEKYTTETFNKTWNVVNPAPSTNSITVVDVDGQKALYVYGSDTTNMAYASIDMAKQYGKFTFNYSFMYPKISPITGINALNTDNGYTRVFLGKDIVPNPNISDDKNNIVMETYIDSAYKTGNIYVVYRNKTAPSSSVPLHSYKLSGDNWYDVSYVVDVSSKTFSAKVASDVGKDNLTFRNNLDYINYIMLGNRKNNNTFMYFKNISVVPVENNYVTDIKFNNTSVKDYSSITKAYLYRGNDLTNKDVTFTDGSNTYTSSVTDNTGYEEIKLLNGSDIVQNNVVYYELDTDKDLLTKYIGEAIDLDSKRYTTDTWSNLVTSLNSAILVLKDEMASQSVIDAAKDDLRSKIDALVLINNINIYYEGYLSYGNNLNNINSESIYITNNSSFTMDASINTSLFTYNYTDSDHNRKIISDVLLPVNTKLTLIDKSKSSYNYYYYVVTTETNTILLSDFKKMGYDDVNYENVSYYDGSTLKLHEDFEVIVDFGEVSNKLSKGGYTIKLVCVLPDIEILMNDLNYYISEDTSSYNMYSSVDKESYSNTDTINMGVNISYSNSSYDDKISINTNVFDKNYGIKVSLYNNDGIVELPSGTSINMGDNTCYVNSNSCVVLIDDDFENIDNLLINFGDYNKLSNGTYKFKLELIESENGLNTGKIVATYDQAFSINTKSSISFKVTRTDNNIIKVGNSKTIKYSFSTLDVTNPKIIVYLDKKDSGSFTRYDIADYIDNNLVEYDDNRYIVGNVSDIDLIFKNNLSKGTYRLSFMLLDSSVEENIEEQFIVVK